MAEAALPRWDDPALGLDRRLLKAVARMGFASPTPLQADALPVLLRGKDCVVEGRTGEGKTALYALAFAANLNRTGKSADTAKSALSSPLSSPRVLVLVPTRELVAQTAKVVADVCFYTDLKTAGIEGLKGSKGKDATRGSREGALALAEDPDIVIATPAALVPFLQEESASRHGVRLSLQSCKVFVMDEADLMMTFGYHHELKAVIAALPKTGCQRLMVSATASSALEELKTLTLSTPVTIKTSKKHAGAKLTQFYLRIGYLVDRYLLLFSLLKLRLISGKTLIFVKDSYTAFKVRLFLERFSIPSAVLNSELPVNSRAHIISSFNRGIFDLLIATDENMLHAAEDGTDADITPHDAEHGSKRKRQSAPSSSRAKRARTVDGAADSEFGVSRGVDFHLVNTVVNFDFPATLSSYVHRVGRTARGGVSGVALSFVPPEGTQPEVDAILSELQTSQPPCSQSGAQQPSPLPFNVAEIEGFRYRVEDMLRSVTDARIREARLADIRQEMVASETLRSHFEDHPRDAEILAKVQHDKALAPKSAKPHLKDVPDYLLPPSLKAAVEAAGAGVAMNSRKKKSKARKENAPPTSVAEIATSKVRVSSATVVALSQAEAYHARRNNKDPLRSFAAARKVTRT